MAQFGSAQREPSMEEILASIRRIIEDSDAGRKAEEGSSDNVPGSGESAADPQSRPEVASTVIEVEAFRSEARTRNAAFESLESAVGRDAPVEPATSDDQGEEPGTATAFQRPAGAEKEAPSRRPVASEEWRLGIVPPDDDDAEPDEFDAAIAGAVMSDLSEPASDAAARLSESRSQADTPPALLSGAVEKQVSAAFGELSEALAARSRRNLDELAEELLRPMLQEWLDNNLPMLVEKLVRQEIERVARGP